MQAQQIRTIVLYADPAFPPRSGADLRNAAHVAAAQPLGPVLAVSLYEGNAALSPVPGASIRARSGASAGGQPIVRLDAVELSSFAAILEQFGPDLALVEGVAFRPLFPAIRTSGARLVVDMHNIESHLSLAIAEAEPWTRPLRRRRARLAGLELAEAERETVRLADAVWVCSEPDRERLAQATGFAGARVLPNGLPPGSRPDEPVRRTYRPRLVFAGHLGYRPNVWAVRELARQVMPLLLRKCPDATLTLAGRSPSRHVLGLAGPSVRVLADPSDMQTVLAGANFAVVPLRQGGGTRIKILEAIAAGLVVVATALAAEGLELEHGKHLLVAETPREMADAISRLAADPEAAMAIAAQGRAHVFARYAPEIIAGRVAAELRSVLSKRG